MSKIRLLIAESKQELTIVACIDRYIIPQEMILLPSISIFTVSGAQYKYAKHVIIRVYLCNYPISLVKKYVLVHSY